MPGRPTLALLVAGALVAGPGRAQAPSTPAAPAAVEAIKVALQKGDVDGAVSAGEKAAAAAPKDALVQTWLGRAYGRKAQSASVFSQLSLAKKQADEILRLDPVRGHVAWGAVWEEAKEPSRAEAEYRKAVEADPKQIRGRIALSSLLVKGKRAPEARDVWQQFSKANPDQTYGHYALARLSVLTGEDLAGGVEHLKAYLATPPKPETPTWADAHWRLSNLYEKMGRGDDAKAELREALRLNPDHAFAKKDLKRLEG